MRHGFLLVLLSFLDLASTQETETTTIIIAPSTVILATTLTSYAPDTTVTVTPTGPASPQYSSNTHLITSILNSTNFFRWEHNASFLAWNASLATYASNYAQQCMWAHSHGPPGENLARGYPDATSAVEAWGNERSLYNFTTPTGYTEATGHFTQLVWKSTQTVGCAALNCDGRNGVQGWFLVCEYWPTGNIVGQGSNVDSWFRANVQSQVNSGQGFNVASATAGASGVGTSWATSAGLPTQTLLQGNTRKGKTMNFELEAISCIFAFLGAMGLY